MATQLQLRKGTKIQNDAFTGAEGELTYVSDTKGLRLHDGSTQGGFEVPVLVAVQRPAAGNNYTWYRLYSDGWVEQGGHIPADTDTAITINLPVEMADTNYSWNVGVDLDRTTQPTWNNVSLFNRTTTTVDIMQDSIVVKSWEVKGMAA